MPWYVSPEAHTFVILDADEFVMGSIDRRPEGSDPDEVPHRRRIGRKFAIATKEVTNAQWRRFEQDVTPGKLADDELSQRLHRQAEGFIEFIGAVGKES